METVFINNMQLQSIEMFRIALSAADNRKRLQALDNLKQEVAAQVDELYLGGRSEEWISSPANADFFRRSAFNAPARRTAAAEFAQTEREYEDNGRRRKEMKLNIAEYIGTRVWQTIRDGKFEGLQTDIGILEQVRHSAKKEKIFGAQDRDTLRKTWGRYRGVVHLGMALDLHEGSDLPLSVTLSFAEEIRVALSYHCPRGTKKPYVDEGEQISFVSKAVA